MPNNFVWFSKMYSCNHAFFSSLLSHFLLYALQLYLIFIKLNFNYKTKNMLIIEDLFLSLCKYEWHFLCISKYINISRTKNDHYQWQYRNCSLIKTQKAKVSNMSHIKSDLGLGGYQQ